MKLFAFTKSLVMISIRTLSLFVGVACLGMSTGRLEAQSSMFGSSSLSGRGSSMSGGTSGGMGSFGSGGMGSMGGGGMSGTGGMGMGSGGTGGFGGTGGGTGFGNAGTGFGNSQGAFVGRNANPNQFVGMNNLTGGNQGQLGNNMGNNFGNRQGSFGGLGNRGANSNPLQNLNQGAGNQTQNQAIQLRARQRVAFDYPKPAPIAWGTTVQTRFEKVTGRNAEMRGVTLSLQDGGVVVLQGDVASESAARLAEKLVRLEPGVRSVRSELTYPEPVAEE